MHLWQMVRELFEVDDGSLPDIFVEGLEADQVIKIIERLESLIQPISSVKVWSTTDEIELQKSKLKDAALEVVLGNVEPFRIFIGCISINSIRLPEMTVFIDRNEISFDYRMGPSWNEITVMALFELLSGIKEIAPNATIFQAFEGGYENPNSEFSAALEIYQINGAL